MKFAEVKMVSIMKLMEVKVDWNVEDREYLGPIAGYVAGFNYEVVDKDGILDYMSAYYMHEDPTQHVEDWEVWTGADYFETVRQNGFEPTGRVVFRGYAREMYDPDLLGCWDSGFIVDAHDEAIASLR